MKKLIAFLRRLFRRDKKRSSIQVDSYRIIGGETVFHPRVILGRTASEELRKFLGGSAWVNYDPSATYVSIMSRGSISPREVEMLRGQIILFLEQESSRWILPRR